ALGHLVDAPVRLGGHVTEAVLGAAAVALVVERLHRHARGDLAGAGAAHAVGHGEHGLAVEVRVLVALPLAADVGEAGVLRDQKGHAVTPGSGTRSRLSGSRRTAAAPRPPRAPLPVSWGGMRPRPAMSRVALHATQRRNR